MFAYCNNAPINYYDPNGTDCICLTQRVRGNHICYDHDKISFEEIYYNNTGKQYDYQVNKYENVSVVKSEEIITKTDVILRDSILFILEGFVSYASKGISKGIGFVFGATKFMGEISSLDVGTYSTYSVTKTHYYKQAVEVANYHGYRVYQDKTFKYTVTEIYYVSNGEFAKIDIFYTDSYYAYKYRNRY